MSRRHMEVSTLLKFRVVIAWALVLAVLVSGSAMAGSPGSSDGQLASAAKKKKKKKKKKPAAPAAPVAGAPVVAAPAAQPPGDGGGGPVVDDVLFDVTAVSGNFDASVMRPDGGCTVTKDAHWTAALASGAEPARLINYYTDDQGPVYIFNASDIPLTVTGNGVATRTCNLPDPAPNGTASCTFQRTDPMDATVSSDPDGSRDPINLEWFFGYNVFYYANPANGGSCTYTGPRPPSLSSVEDSPGLFVSPSNDGSNLLEPVGKSSVPLSQFNGDTMLNFSGSTSGASWQLSVSLDRR